MKWLLKILLALTFFSVFDLNAQEAVRVNMIICVDGEIVKSLYSPKMELVDEGGKKNIPVGYFPGNLSIDSSDFKSLTSTDDLSFVFSVRDNEQIERNYQISISKEWLIQNYFILYIYNTDKRNYKGKLSPLPGKNYTFELDYPGGQMLRLRNK